MAKRMLLDGAKVGDTCSMKFGRIVHQGHILAVGMINYLFSIFHYFIALLE